MADGKPGEAALSPPSISPGPLLLSHLLITQVLGQALGHVSEETFCYSGTKLCRNKCVDA